MVRIICSQRGLLAALQLTKLFEIDDFSAAKDSGKVVIIIIYCYLIIIIFYLATGKKVTQNTFAPKRGRKKEQTKTKNTRVTIPQGRQVLSAQRS